jgi:hypothetical protein
MKVWTLVYLVAILWIFALAFFDARGDGAALVLREVRVRVGPHLVFLGSRTGSTSVTPKKSRNDRRRLFVVLGGPLLSIALEDLR